MDESVQKHLTPALDDASKVLLKAAALIEAGGLAKGHLQVGESFCVIGAISYAMFGKVLPQFGKEMRDCEAIKRMQRAVNHFVLPHWNNHADRTAAEVVSKLRAVALGL